MDIRGTINRPTLRPDLSLFNSVRLHFRMKGVSEQQARQLVEAFKGRGPLYGTVAVAAPDVQVEVDLETLSSVSLQQGLFLRLRDAGLPSPACS